PEGARRRQLVPQDRGAVRGPAGARAAGAGRRARQARGQGEVRGGAYPRGRAAGRGYDPPRVAGGVTVQPARAIATPKIGFVAFFLLWAQRMRWEVPPLHVRVCQWLERAWLSGD